MAPQLRALSTLAENLGSIPSIHMVACNYNSSSRKSNVLFWPLWVPGTHMVHRHTYKQIIIHIKQNKHFQTCWITPENIRHQYVLWPPAFTHTDMYTHLSHMYTRTHTHTHTHTNTHAPCLQSLHI